MLHVAGSGGCVLGRLRVYGLKPPLAEFQVHIFAGLGRFEAYLFRSIQVGSWTASVP